MKENLVSVYMVLCSATPQAMGSTDNELRIDQERTYPAVIDTFAELRGVQLNR
jgi:hypothetical protein